MTKSITVFQNEEQGERDLLNHVRMWILTSMLLPLRLKLVTHLKIIEKINKLKIIKAHKNLLAHLTSIYIMVITKCVKNWKSLAHQYGSFKNTCCYH